MSAAASPASAASAADATRDALALSLVSGVGPVRWREMLEVHGGAAGALRALSAPVRDAAVEAAARALEDAHGAGAVALVQGDAAYPAALLDLPDPPPLLFALGDLQCLAAPAVSVVGTRDCTGYGERMTREIAGALARAGACVVSGMARGIDAAAHRAALDAGAPTVAVLGTGVDVPYPSGHAALHAAVAERGLVLSEALPGARATAGAFPRRNRLVAALAPLTIVVEAGERSGALITAGCALELGRTVAAVPGPIDSAASAGANELIRDGACVVASVADALALAGLTPAVRASPAMASAAERAVWDALRSGALDLDTLTAAARLPARECLAAVTSLEMAGAVECTLTGAVRRR